jgi:hypothetical protein
VRVDYRDVLAEAARASLGVTPDASFSGLAHTPVGAFVS